jgi:hypothetical protein
MIRFGALIGIAWLGFAWTGASQAEIYKFVDDNGFVTYTNMPRPGIKPQMVIPDPTQAADKTVRASKASKRKAGTRSSTPGYFPRIDSSTQRKRDDMRRQLLEQEMSSEQHNLAAAKSAFAEGSRHPGSDLNKLLDAVRLHEKNIQMLNQELSHIR